MLVLILVDLSAFYETFASLFLLGISMMKWFTCLMLLSLFAVSVANGQEKTVTIFPIIAEGDMIPGVGMVDAINNVAVNDFGETLVEVNTNQADTESDEVLLRNGIIAYQEGIFGTIDLPTGVFINRFDAININNSGDTGHRFFLDPLEPAEDSGIYLNGQLIVQEGEFTTAAGLSPGTPFVALSAVKFTNTGKFLTVAIVDDPAIESEIDRVIMLIDGDSQTVIAKEGDVLPGQTVVADDFANTINTSAINDNDDVMFAADLATGDTATNFAFYLNSTLLAQEGSPSPIPGRNYQTLFAHAMDLNNAGEFIYKANLDGDTSDDYVLVLNGQVFRREGGPAPDGFVFQNFGSANAPIEIANNGDVLWFGDWNNPDFDFDTGLFLNDTLIVQEGVTMVGDDMRITGLANGLDTFDMSSDGRWIIFEAEFERDGEEFVGAFAAQIDGGLLGDINCDGQVDLLDVQPFVDVLTSGVFSFKADINSDGVVDLLDVGPFVIEISGG